MPAFPVFGLFKHEGDDLFVLGLVQERKHPDSLQSELKKLGEEQVAT